MTLPGFEPGKYPFRAVRREPTAWFWTGVSAARGDRIAPVAGSRGPAEGVASSPGAGTSVRRQTRKDRLDSGCRSVISGHKALFTKPGHEKHARGTRRTASESSRGSRHAPGKRRAPYTLKGVALTAGHATPRNLDRPALPGAHGDIEAAGIRSNEPLDVHCANRVGLQ